MGNDPNDEKLSEEMIDEILADSFPASDPPSWTLGREKKMRSTDDSPKTEESKPSTVDTKDRAAC